MNCQRTIRARKRLDLERGGREIIIDRSEIEVQYGAGGGNNLGQRGGGGTTRDYHYCCYLVAAANPQVHQLNDPEVWHAA
jgi:hypothetical protein